MLQVYMPATFIVLMSFTSLWLDRSAVPARVSLGVTTVLTTTTIMSSVKSDLPHTSYPKVTQVRMYCSSMPIDIKPEQLYQIVVAII